MLRATLAALLLTGCAATHGPHCWTIALGQSRATCHTSVDGAFVEEAEGGPVSATFGGVLSGLISAAVMVYGGP